MHVIPFRRFHGHLKQITFRDVAGSEQDLFQLLFPRFWEESYSDAEFAADKAQFATAKAQFEASRISGSEASTDRITMRKGEPSPRRYGGYQLPRGRYYSLCKDAQGDDSQTLVHELRAYRDPVGVGMVEVVDIAHGRTLVIGERQVHLTAQPAVAALIHSPVRMPDRFESLEFDRVEGSNSTEIAVHRFPYRVTEAVIDRTVDLRFPDVREWFFRTCRDFGEVDEIRVAPAELTETGATRAYSQFHLEEGRAPLPTNFTDMLPTLLNPDRGGGNPGSTGGTLLAIGNWLRQVGAGALVYPSARCDVTARFVDGEMCGWDGWNLVDLRHSDPAPDGGTLVTLLSSPWAWVQLPRGVVVDTPRPESRFAGSLAIRGVVDYSAQDYLRQVRGLVVARACYGVEAPDNVARRAFEMGVLTMSWLRRAAQGVPAADIEESIEALIGLALPFDVYCIAGRVTELALRARQGAGLEVVASLEEVVDSLRRALARRHPDSGLDEVMVVGADLERAMLHLAVAARARAAGAPVAVGWTDSTVAVHLSECCAALENRLIDAETAEQARRFHRSSVDALRGAGTDPAKLLVEGENLEQAIRAGLLRRGAVPPAQRSPLDDEL